MLPPSTKPSATGSTGCLRTGTREEDEHPEHRERRERDHDGRRAREEAERDPGVVDVVDRERAGDLDLLAERERARDDLLRQLVRADRGGGDSGEPEPLARPAPSGRSRGRDRAQRVRRRPDADVGRQRASRRAGSVTGQLPRVVDAQRRPGNRLQPLDRDLLPADRARAVRARPRSAAAPPRRRGADPARPPRGPRRTRARRSRSPCLQGGCRRSRTSARRVSSVSDELPMSWWAIVLRSRSRCCSSSARKWSVSMLISGLLSARCGEPSLDLVRLDAGQLDDLVS